MPKEVHKGDFRKNIKMEGCNPSNTPVATSTQLSKEGDGRVIEMTLYKSLVGRLRYLTITRPDIVNGVGLVSRYMEKPMQTHWLVA